MSATARRNGRRPISHRSELVAAGLRIGLDELTALKVAAACGIQPSTFYRYFTSVGELVDDVLDTALSTVSWPDETRPWREHLRDLARVLDDVVTAHPGMAGVLWRRAPDDRPGAIRRAEERAVRVLLAAGLTAPSAADMTVSLLLDEATGGRARPTMHRVELILDGIAARLADPDGSAGPDRGPRGTGTGGPAADIVPAVPQQQPAVIR